MKLDKSVITTTSLLLLSSLAAATQCYDENGAFSIEEWKYCQEINDELFMYYTPLEEEGNVMLGLHAVNHDEGWSALAFGGNGGMKGASQIVVRKDENGEWVAEDRSSEDYVAPTLDDSQDVRLLFAEDTNGDTSWGVLLMMDSCDENDYAIEDLSMWMHWALGSSHDFVFHGNKRGQFHANLHHPPQVPASVDNLEFLDLRMPDVDIAPEEGGDPTNTYLCGIFDLTQVREGHQVEDKFQAIRFSAFLNPDSTPYVHHMVLYSCEAEASRLAGYEHLQVLPSCESMPPGCLSSKWTWAVGVEDAILPDDVGFPFGEGEQFLMLQMHYYNPSLDNGIIDSSGIRVYVAPEHRPIDAGNLNFAGGTSSIMRPIPMEPGIKALTIPHMYIPSSCTSSWTSPLTVLGVLHHQHLIGTHMQSDVYRNGQNIGPIRVEHNYDFNHQSSEESRIRVLYPGDEIRLSCTYDTSQRTTPTPFGEKSQDEMCLATIMYYPRQEMQNLARLPVQDVGMCLQPGTGSYNDVSLCAQRFTENAIEFLNMESMVPFGLPGAQFCNMPVYEERVKPNNPTLCPPCHESKSCTDALVKEWSQNVACLNICSEYNLSLFPNTTNVETDVSQRILCHDRRVVFAAEDLPAQECERKGDLEIAVGNDLGIAIETITGTDESDISVASNAFHASFYAFALVFCAIMLI